MIRPAVAAAMLLALITGVKAEPPKTLQQCMARVQAVVELVQRAKLSDEMQARIEDELGRARANCGAGLFADADKAMALAERLAKGEPDPD